MAQFLFDKDVRISPLRHRTIGIIGYGNQGGAQALNLRDSGCRVLIGNRNDRYARQARNDGFEVMSIRRAVTAADILIIAIPDEIQEALYQRHIQPALRSGQVGTWGALMGGCTKPGLERRAGCHSVCG